MTIGEKKEQEAKEAKQNIRSGLHGTSLSASSKKSSALLVILFLLKQSVDVIFQQLVCTVAFLGLFVADHEVSELVHVTRGPKDK
jgi:hypothetical protein